jgi:hypothetical protein
MESTAGKAASKRVSVIAATEARASISPTGPPVNRTPIETAAISIPAAVAVATTEPGAGADEDTTVKPRRAIVSVGCAGVRIVTVIAIGADGSGITIVAAVYRGADPNTYRDLGMRISRSGE